MCSLANETKQDTEHDFKAISTSSKNKKLMPLKQYTHSVICKYYEPEDGAPHEELINFIVQTFNDSGRRRNREVNRKVVDSTLRHLEREGRIRREVRKNKSGKLEIHWFPIELAYDETVFRNAEPRTLKALAELESANPGAYTAWEINEKLMKTDDGEGVYITKTGNAIHGLCEKKIVERVGVHSYSVVRGRAGSKKATKRQTTQPPQQLTLGDADITNATAPGKHRVATGLTKQIVMGGFKEALQSNNLSDASSREVGEVLKKRGFNLTNRRGVHSFLHGLFKAGVLTRRTDPETFTFRYTLADPSKIQPKQGRFSTIIARVASQNPQDIQDAKYFPDVMDAPPPTALQTAGLPTVRPPSNPTPPPSGRLEALLEKARSISHSAPEHSPRALSPIETVAQGLQKSLDSLSATYSVAIATSVLEREDEVTIGEIRWALIDFLKKISG
jgi:hypothetical protein